MGLLKKENILCDPGSDYGSGGVGFLRLNLASPRASFEAFIKALERIYTEVKP